MTWSGTPSSAKSELGLHPDLPPGPLRETPQGLAVRQPEERTSGDTQACQRLLEHRHQGQVVYPIPLLVPAPDLARPHPQVLGLQLENGVFPHAGVHGRPDHRPHDRRGRTGRRASGAARRGAESAWVGATGARPRAGGPARPRSAGACPPPPGPASAARQPPWGSRGASASAAPRGGGAAGAPRGAAGPRRHAGRARRGRPCRHRCRRARAPAHSGRPAPRGTRPTRPAASCPRPGRTRALAARACQGGRGPTASVRQAGRDPMPFKRA